MKNLLFLSMLFLVGCAGGPPLNESSGGNPGEMELREVRAAFAELRDDSHFSYRDTSTANVHLIGIADHNGRSGAWLCTASAFAIENGHSGSWRQINSDDIRIIMRSKIGEGDVLVVMGEATDSPWENTCEPDSSRRGGPPGVGAWFGMDIGTLEVIGGAGDDIIIAPATRSRITYCHVEGGSGDDFIEMRCLDDGTTTNFFGRSGDDTIIIARAGEGSAFGGDGNDKLVNNGTDAANLFCGPGNDLTASTTPPRNMEDCEGALLAEPNPEEACSGPICIHVDFFLRRF